MGFRRLYPKRMAWFYFLESDKNNVFFLSTSRATTKAVTQAKERRQAKERLKPDGNNVWGRKVNTGRVGF